MRQSTFNLAFFFLTSKCYFYLINIKVWQLGCVLKFFSFRPLKCCLCGRQLELLQWKIHLASQFSIYSFQCYWQLLQASTDPSQQFSAPFKAGNSRQVQTCYIPQTTTQRNCNIITGLPVQEKRKFSWPWTIERQCKDACRLRVPSFSLWCSISFGILLQQCDTVSLSHYAKHAVPLKAQIKLICSNFENKKMCFYSNSEIYNSIHKT